MIAVALKGLAGRKVRALLTAFAIVIGVSMVSGTYVLTDTMQKAFDGIFTASYEDTDAVITGKEVVAGSSSGAAPVPESLLAEVRALPEVEAAGGTIGGDDSAKAEILDDDGKALNRGDAPALGLGYDTAQPQFSPLKLKEGEWAQGPSQVVIDAGTADHEGYRVGDSVQVSTLGLTKRYEVTGVATYGDVDSIGGATLAVFDQSTARTLLHKQGVYDGISIAAKDGTSPTELVRAIEPLVPSSLQVRDAAAEAEAQAKDTNEGLSFVRYFLLGFGGIALFVGAFVIFNTLSITVAQRTREFATLRTLGASRRQVLRSVVLESLALGLVASLIGLGLGVALAAGLSSLLQAVGMSLPQTALVFATRTSVIAIVAGTTVTLLAGIVPAFKATRVPPIAAVREGAILHGSQLRSQLVGLALGIVGALLLIKV